MSTGEFTCFFFFQILYVFTGKLSAIPIFSFFSPILPVWFATLLKTSMSSEQMKYNKIAWRNYLAHK